MYVKNQDSISFQYTQKGATETQSEDLRMIHIFAKKSQNPEHIPRKNYYTIYNNFVRTF